jgi:hypothetical protein
VLRYACAPASTAASHSASAPTCAAAHVGPCSRSTKPSQTQPYSSATAPVTSAARTRPASTTATNAAVAGHTQPAPTRNAPRSPATAHNETISTVSGHRRSSSAAPASATASDTVITMSRLPPVSTRPAGTPSRVSAAAAGAANRSVDMETSLVDMSRR